MDLESFFSSFLGDLTIAGIILFLTFLGNKIISNMIKKTIKRKNNKNLTTILMFINKLKSFAICVLGFLIALSRFEMFSTISVALISVLGVGATVISLSFKESLSNFFSSFELVISKPFEIGDYLVLPEKNISGKVEEITMRHTILKTENNKKEILPNKTLNLLIIENHNRSYDEIILNTIFTIDSKADVDKVIKIIKEEIITVCELTPEEVNNKIEYPKVDVIEWDMSSTKLKAHVISNKMEKAQEMVYKLNYNVKKRLNKAKI